MTAAKTPLRRKVERLLADDPGQRDSAIARTCACSVRTVQRVREELGLPAPSTGRGTANLLPPAEPGNRRRKLHGAYGSGLEAARADKHLELRRRFPNVDDALLVAQSIRLVEDRGALAVDLRA